MTNGRSNGDEGNAGVMSVEQCRQIQGSCEERQRKFRERVIVDLALIKRHLGINGQYAVKPHPTRRAADTEDHDHFRDEDVVIEHAGKRAEESWLKRNWWALVLAAIAGERLLTEMPKALARILGNGP